MTSIRMPPKSVPFILILLCIHQHAIFGCMRSERSALLDFKHGLEDRTDRLASWTSEACCNWDGVACSNRTGHVVRLDLGNPHPFSDTGDLPYNRWSLGGKLSPSLLGLKHLGYLDLSMNNFGGIRIPEFFGSFRHLRYLNLSRAGLGGLIPHQLGNLSRLQHLDLYNDLDPSFVTPVSGFVVDDARWISGLSSLRLLDMKNVKFRNVANWVEALNMLPNAVEINLSGCDLGGISPSLPHVNFTNLSVLDLHSSFINSSMIPLWLFNISSLSYLDLSGNFFRGSIPPAVENLTSIKALILSNNELEGGLPKELGSLCKLQILEVSGIKINGGLPELGEIFSGCIKNSIESLGLADTRLTSYLPGWLGELRMLKTLSMGRNSLTGSLPESLGRLSALQKLDLSYNMFNGTLPESLGRLSNLVALELHGNNLQGMVSEAHFANLSRLENLDLSSNRLVIKVSPDWVPPFKPIFIKLGSCTLGPEFPAWLQTQSDLVFLNISNAGIVDTLPDWFSKMFSHSRGFGPYVDVSNNGIRGRLPDLSDFVISDLSSNSFDGPLPNLTSTMQFLDLSNNSFSGTIHPGIGKSLPNLNYLSLAKNKLHGNIPLSLCELENLQALDLSKNHLSGELPNCWKQHHRQVSIRVLYFEGNNLCGAIPSTFGSLASLESLHVSNNGLSGELPLSMRKCTNLVALDLGQNKLTGQIPTWIGEKLLSLKILRLRSNLFAGKIPPNLSRLRNLQVLDLAKNNLSGGIPRSFGNFTAMVFTQRNDGPIVTRFARSCGEHLQMMIKGIDLEYAGLLPQVILLDLSGNALSGEMPEELGNLLGLVSLNLSGNHLTGHIPDGIGSMHFLESLDLSMNELSGSIPWSISSLTYLGVFNLSYNNLSGIIPTGNQLRTFAENSYIGNPGLCGFPLNKCNDDATRGLVGENNGEKEAISDTFWLYLSMGPGFVVGFWMVWGTLLLKKNWRDAYFQSVDHVNDRIYVFVMVNLNMLKRKYNVTARG